MTTSSQKRFVDVGHQIYTDLVKGYHETLHNDTYGELEDNRTTYKMLAEMAFVAAAEFTETFRHQEVN